MITNQQNTGLAMLIGYRVRRGILWSDHGVVILLFLPD
jgi:hypothetical protein